MNKKLSETATQADARHRYTSTAEEVLASLAPHQRAVLRVLAVAHQYDMDPVPLLVDIATELPNPSRFFTRQLSAQIEQGIDPVDALVDVPTLLTPQSVLALRLARDDGTLSIFYRVLAEDFSESNASSAPATENQLVQTLRLIGRIMMVVMCLTFLMKSIVPLLKSLFVDYGVEFPESMNFLIQISSYFVTYWFIAILIILVLIPFCFSASRAYFNSWNPLTWRQAPLPLAVNRRRSLALATQTGQPIMDSLAVIPYSRSDKTLKQLEKAHKRIENGQGEWESLADEKIITQQEAESLSLCASGEARAWLLRWSAFNQKNRDESRSMLGMRVFTGVVNVTLALAVALACIAVFSCLITLMNSLNQPGV